MNPSELPIAQKKNNLSIVLTEMSAGCPGGLEQTSIHKISGSKPPSPLIYQSTFFSAKCHNIHIDNFYVHDIYDHN
jgi:hypothetical protein